MKPVYQRIGLLDIKVVEVYYKTMEMLKSINEKETNTYWQLKQLIEENENEIPLECLKNLNSLSRNFLVYLYNNLGHQDLRLEIFQLYRNHLEKGYLNYRSGILPSTFKNMVNSALVVGDYGWVKQFLQEYKDKIEGTQHPQDVYHFNKALYYSYLQEYDKALELLSDQYEDMSYKLAARRLELRILFDTNSTLLDARMDAFKLMVHRLPDKTTNPRKRTQNNNFINFLRQIRNPKTLHSAVRIDKLKQKIKTTSLVFDREWLLQVLDDLKGQNN